MFAAFSSTSFFSSVCGTQLTETGGRGVSGVTAASRVVRESKPGHVNVTAHHPNMTAIPVLVLTLKTTSVEPDPAQVSVHESI